MQRIAAPVIRDDRGPAVVNLHDALLLLLSAGRIELPGAERDALADRLARDQRDGVYGAATVEAVAALQRQYRTALDLPQDTGEQVDEPTAAGLNRLLTELGAFTVVQPDGYLVAGRVEYEDASPAVGLRLSVFDREIGDRRVPLGDTDHPVITAQDGTFPAIRYREAAFVAGEGRRGPGADLVFTVASADTQDAFDITAIYRVLTVAGTSVETAVPDLVLGFEAGRVEHVRIVLAGRPREGGRSEFDRLTRDLQPLMLDGSTPADFDQEQFRDVDFAARETGWDAELIETARQAWVLARAASQEPTQLVETFYGLLRSGPPTQVAALPANLDELLNQDTRWAAKLDDSLAQRIIGRAYPDRLRQLRTRAAVQPGQGRTASMGDVLARAGIAEEQRHELLDAYVAHTGDIEEFWSTVVPQRLGWTGEQVQAAQSELQYAELLNYDTPLIAAVRERGHATARDLTALTRHEWTDLITRVGPPPQAPGETPAEQITATVDAISGLVAAAYPTDVVAHIARTSPDAGLSEARDLLGRFFATHTTGDNAFDVLTSPVTQYLDTHRDRVFDGLGDADRALLTGQLQRLQRVFRLGVDRAQTESLLDLNLDSAFRITRFSPEHFVAEFADRLGGPDAASKAYGRAESIAGTVLYMYTDLWQGLHGVQPMAVRGSYQPEQIAALKQLPTYKALFGSAELCDCGDCQSFYSPAAYFVDLLHMLDRPTLGAGNPVEALLRRRPDLGSIQLTCSNTNTLIPYVDLVTEVLESFVANRAPLAFNQPPPPPNSQLPAPSAEELRVNPVYLTTASATYADQAYAALQDAVFPLNLPLNLPLETARTFLGHLGTSRVDLMRLFDRDPGLEAIMAQAAEILLLAPEEFELVTGSTFGGASAPRPKTTAELFGLSMANTPTENPRTLFNHGAPEFARTPANPDARTALISSLQNALGVLTPKPVPVTGVYDVATENAVNAYLTSKGLPGNGHTDDAFWGALEGDGTISLSAMMCPVPMLLARAGLTYPDLIALVETRFLNPTLQGEGDLDYLNRLDIPAADVRAWLQAGLPALPAAMQAKLVAAGEDPAAFTDWVRQRRQAVVLNSAFGVPCDLDSTTLMHLDGTLLSPDELVTLFRFIRLWRKLGWTLAELDLVLEPGSLAGSAVFNTVLLLANAAQLRDHVKLPVADLVCLWQPIPTHGTGALYDRLFRNRAAELIDPILALNADRDELAAAGSATPPALSEHVVPVLAALRLSAQQLAAVRQATGLADDPSPTANPATQPRLTLAALSAIYRVVALARGLSLSVFELITLMDLTGLPVFERPDRFPRGAALQFADLADKVRRSGVKPTELEYLCRGIAQPPGLPGTERDSWRRTLAALIDGLHGIEAEEPADEDPVGEQLTVRLTGLLGVDDATATTAMIYGRDVYTATLAGLPVPFVFPAAVQARASYDATRKLLRFRGPMTATDKAAMLGATGVPPSTQLAYSAAVSTLHVQPRAFVTRALAAMFTPAEAVAALIEVSTLDATGAPIPAVIDAKVADVLARRRGVLSRALVKQTLSTATDMPADIVATLLDNDTVLTALGGTGVAMPDYQDLAGDGLSASYYAAIAPTGVPVLQRVDGRLAFDWQGVAPGPGVPVTGFSVRWEGSVYVPAAGAVTLQVRCSDGVRVTIDGNLVIDEWRDQPLTQFNATLKLDGQRFYPVEIEYYNQTGGAAIEIGWSSPSVPATVIAQASMYTAARLNALLQRVERVYKIGRLLGPFTLTSHELEQLAAHGDLNLDLLPVGGPVGVPAAQAMFTQWLTVNDFAALRERYQAADVTLIDVPTAASPQQALARFVALSGVDADTLASIVEIFTTDVFDPVTTTWAGVAPDLSTLLWWQRIADAVSLVHATGAAPRQLLAWARTREIDKLPAGPQTAWFTWTGTDESGTDRHPDNRRLAQEARDLVRARHDEDGWRAAATQLNDVLRERRTAALTAYVLAMPEMMRAKVTDTGRMFEFFLIDVEMQACMATSRIKQGISSVQLYIQRVLLDLESPLVPPGRVDRARWEWMRNYRVWEANRKVFLHAESYVTEQLRDNKTPIFEELESELLQDELTDPNAERALRHYLEKLDHVAKLTVCGTCVDADTGTLHVFGRSATMPFVFYHRRCERRGALSWSDGVWSPWQKLPVDVAAVSDGDDSGVHLMPLVWNRRLYLFWLNFEQKPQTATNAALPQGFDQIDCWHITLAWSEYKDGRWSGKQIGAPYAVSGSYVDNIKMANETYRSFAPDHVNWESVTYIDTPFGPVILDRDSGTDIKPIVINGDPLLNGTKLVVDGDWASHDHREDTTVIRSLLPKPVEHYLDAQVSGGALTIRVFARFRGYPAGQGRTTVKDVVAVVRDGKRTDRTEQDQTDFTSKGAEQRVFQQVGTFHFPACTADLDGGSTLVALKYESLVRPQDTVNAFMALRQDFPRVSGLKLPGASAPILKFVPNRFEVIDSDNRTGFARMGPFFYQDQQRCYLVTRSLLGRSFRTHTAAAAAVYGAVQPDARVGMAQRAVGLSALKTQQLDIAADSALATHPWAARALAGWAAGPGVPAGMRGEPAEPMHTMSLTLPLNAQTNLIVDEPAMQLWGWSQNGQGDYLFTPHWHQYTCSFMAALNSGGLPALYTLDQQRHTDQPGLVLGGTTKSHFVGVYQPDPAQVASPYPLETVDFARTGTYSIYNWEIFYHAPILIATQLTRAGRYEDAMRWFHFVFDPMTGDPDNSDRRYWRFDPFRTADTTRIEDSVTLLSYTGTDPVKIKRRAELRASIAEWIANPFRPDVIARRRPVVYMKHVFMKYLDNLIAWADELFQRDTIEAINEAVQLYILAANLLGPRPQDIPAPGPVAPETFQSLRARLDELSNAQVDLETRLPFTELFAPPAGAVGGLTQLPQTLYFCLPQNELLLGYWDTIADRLFKIRHCMDIGGTVRDLPLFEPPIDPMLLIEAVANGLDIGSVLNDLYAPLSRYRFSFMLTRALSLCEEVKTLGGALLSIMEKRDTERLSMLRATHETQLLDLVTQNKKLQISEAEQTRQGLDIAAQIATARMQYYDNLIAQGLISEETDQLESLDTSNQRQETASWIEATAQLLNLVPNFSSGSTGASVSFGGSNLGAAATAVARSYTYLAGSYAYKANRASITGGQSRRADEWRFQRDLAKRDISQIQRQIAAAQIRQEIAQAELRNHELQKDHARSIEEMLRTKFTNEALYGWLEGTLRTLHFQCYQAAYEVAKRAERCWQYERGSDATFIKFGAWDSSVRGLLAGERLHLQLRQMERATLEQQIREFEITKHVSVVQLDPLALIALKETGSCEIEIPEWAFDVDYAGHYFRRLKTVAITIPAVVGPYTSLNATLTLLSSKVRESARPSGGYADDDNYRPDHLAVEAIAASGAQNDSGRFELNFHDEKYLPFEGAGAISRWRIELPRKFRSFDYDTISDVVLHLKYTARRDETLAGAALTALQAQLDAAVEAPSLRLFSLRHEFPTEWARLLAPGTREATFTISKDRFPLLVQRAAITTTEIHHALILSQARPTIGYAATLTPGTNPPINLDWPAQPGRYRSGAQAAAIPIVAAAADSGWMVHLSAPAAAADLKQIQDVLIVVRYTAAM